MPVRILQDVGEQSVNGTENGRIPFDPALFAMRLMVVFYGRKDGHQTNRGIVVQAVCVTSIPLDGPTSAFCDDISSFQSSADPTKKEAQCHCLQLDS